MGVFVQRDGTTGVTGSTQQTYIMRSAGDISPHRCATLSVMCLTRWKPSQNASSFNLWLHYVNASTYTKALRCSHSLTHTKSRRPPSLIFCIVPRCIRELDCLCCKQTISKGYLPYLFLAHFLLSKGTVMYLSDSLCFPVFTLPQSPSSSLIHLYVVVSPPF